MPSFSYTIHCFNDFVGRLPSLLRPKRTIERYIWGKLVGTQSAAILFLYLMFLINNFLLIATSLLALKVSVRQVLWLIISLTPSTITWTMPFSALIGTLLAIGRMSSDNEVTAACFIGCTYYQLLKPFLLFGIYLTSLNFINNEILCPQGHKIFQKTMQDIAESTPSVLIESNSSQKLGDIVLIVGPIRDDEIDGVVIIDMDSRGYKRLIHAKNARFVQSQENRGLTFVLQDVQGISADKKMYKMDYQLISAHDAEYHIHISNDQMRNITTSSDKTLKDTWTTFKARVAAYQNNKKARRQQASGWLGSVSDSYLKVLTLPGTSSNEPKSFYKRYLNTAGHLKPDYDYRIGFIDFYQRLCLPIACSIFVFLAFSLSIGAKKTKQTGMLALGVIFSMLYWFGMSFMMQLVIVKESPVWVTGGMDLLFILLGFVLFIRIKK